MRRGIAVLISMITISFGMTVNGMEEDISEAEDIVAAQPVQTEKEEEYVIVIDAGHQAVCDLSLEPIGPGAKEMKRKVSAGAVGCVTKLAEYELNLQVALKLQSVLEERGYTVVMVRTTHDVNISNSQRAQIANEAKADAFIRIHANSFTDSSARGILTVCQTRKNPYNGALYEKSRLLSDCVLSQMMEETGAKGKVWETDTMSGINWCETPVTIVEMGYMSNPKEDRLMATEDYQNKLTIGMADGIDAYFAGLSAE